MRHLCVRSCVRSYVRACSLTESKFYFVEYSTRLAPRALRLIARRPHKHGRVAQAASVLSHEHHPRHVVVVVVHSIPLSHPPGCVVPLVLSFFRCCVFVFPHIFINFSKRPIQPTAWPYSTPMAPFPRLLTVRACRCASEEEERDGVLGWMGKTAA